MSIYLEHLTETGCLLSHRISYFEDPAIPWPDVYELEDRIAAHVDGIELGGDLARQCALEFLATGDEDELRGAAYALATIALDEVGLNAVIDAFTKADDALIPVYIEALKHGKHPNLAAKLLPLLEQERPIIRAATVEILGYRRQGEPKRVWRLLHDADPDVRQAAIVACARYGNKEVLPAIEQMALATAPLTDEFVLPLLVLGSAKLLDDCRRDCANRTTTTATKLIALGLAGAVQDLPFLFANHSHPDLASIALQATGIHGYIHAIPHLLNGLKSERDETKTAAAKALSLITGAGLREKVQVQETEEELTPEDVAGVPAVPKPGNAQTPTLRTIERPSTDLEQWIKWWQQNQRAFQASGRYRHGKLFSLKELVSHLGSPNTPYDERQLTHLELLIHSKCNIGFEPDWFIPNQLASIKQWQALAPIQ